MAAVAFHMPPSKANMLRTLFQEIDKDGTGSVDREEFYSAMHIVDSTLSTYKSYIIINNTIC
jgi:Ca2+-binding EF-hand superfamily protein